LISQLRDYGAPIETVSGAGYRYRTGIAFELPGLWFTPSELVSLLVAQQLLQEAEPGLLRETLTPLRQRIESLLGAEHLGGGEAIRRIRILRTGARGLGSSFEPIVLALVKRMCVKICYRGRGSNEITYRLISPQRLVRYRDNWYLDAWCHHRCDLRSFALERISEAVVDAAPVHELCDDIMDAHYTSAYGIFSGVPINIAVLRFNSSRARWVSEENWHPQQRGIFLPNGAYELRIPYGVANELLMDVMRHGSNVEIIEPESLRQMVKAELQLTLALYSSGS